MREGGIKNGQKKIQTSFMDGPLCQNKNDVMRKIFSEMCEMLHGDVFNLLLSTYLGKILKLINILAINFM